MLRIASALISSREALLDDVDGNLALPETGKRDLFHHFLENARALSLEPLRGYLHRYHPSAALILRYLDPDFTFEKLLFHRFPHSQSGRKSPMQTDFFPGARGGI